MKPFITTIISIAILVLPVLVSGADIQNPNQPANGTWDFKLKKVMEIKNAGDVAIARPHGILVFPDGTLVVHDPKYKKNFLFSPEGKLIKSFGKRGEGPGEIKRQSFIFAVGNTMIAPDGGKYHYFSKSGEYIKSVKTDPGPPPSLFLNLNQIIRVTHSAFDVKDAKGNIHLIDLNTKKKKVLADFEVFKGGAGDNDGEVYEVIIPGLTPMMTTGLYANHLYYGMNDQYKITVIDSTGTVTGSFSLDRERRGVTKKQKQDLFKGSRIPPKAVAGIVKSLPSQKCHFEAIEGHNGKIFVYVAGMGKHRKNRAVDIFSLDGKYLYSGVFDFGKGYTLLFSPFGNFRIVKDHLYAVIENPDGEVSVVKYKIALP